MVRMLMSEVPPEPEGEEAVEDDPKRLKKTTEGVGQLPPDVAEEAASVGSQADPMERGDPADYISTNDDLFTSSESPDSIVEQATRSRQLDVIGYIRTSTSKQDLSPDAQRRAINASAAAYGWTVGFVEDTCSGSVPFEDRDGARYALSLLQNGSKDALAVSKLDRACRSAVDFLHLMERAKREGWDLIMLDLGVDTTTSTRKMVAESWRRSRNRARPHQGTHP